VINSVPAEQREWDCRGFGLFFWTRRQRSIFRGHPTRAASTPRARSQPPEWSGDLVAAARFGSPEAIRAALLPEQVSEFDAAFDAALTSARRTLHLDELRHVLLAWRRVALMTQMDPDAHRETLSAIAEIRRTGAPRPGSMSWEELKVELGR
jgi:hypothetical protein